MSTEKRSIRCAIYTRKSSEEGLEQSFNSLHAQREACEAFILSQRQEGWCVVESHYDDGGYSGGSIERPALKQLLAAIEAKKIDTVVVYKVDRLTRSLADFAKIIEAFDARGVSFVSVTQQFNTTSSMGRLTLNVLLSFAQFEREVTGERIRDKIAASKRKGIWMGGRVPLGYDLKDRCLLINEKEAECVREIFELYLELGCVKRLKASLDQREVNSKARTSASGRKSGGTPYSRGALYKILQNRIYLGEIQHKEHSYAGAHEAIVDRHLWDKVQAKLKENAQARRHGKNASAPSALRGLLYDEDGNRFTPSHAVKNGKRYRYYISQKVIRNGPSTSREPNRIPAREIEELVLTRFRSFFDSAYQIAEALGRTEDNVSTTRTLVQSAAQFAMELEINSATALNEALTAMVFRIIVRQHSVELQLKRAALRARLLGLSGSSGPKVEDDPLIFTIPAELKHCRGEMRLIISDPSMNQATRTAPSLLRAVSRAHEWVRLILAGQYKDQRAIAGATDLDERYISRILPGAFLAPEIVQAIVEGRQSPDLTLEGLLGNLPLSWEKQRGMLFGPK